MEAFWLTTLVEARASRTPDALAVVTDNQRLTYGALEARAEALAVQFQALGVGPEDRVGVCAPRGPALIIALLGTLKAGAVYVPLDSSWPPERLATVLEDSGARVLVTDGRPLPGQGARSTVVVDPSAPLPPGHRARVTPGVALMSERLAYVIYTSGTTGRPKGVAVTHGAVRHFTEAFVREFALAPGDRVSLLASPAFDASVLEVWPALAAGASLHVADDTARLVPERLQQWLLQRAIHVCFLTTALGEQLASLSWPTAPTLRAVLTGGEALRVRPHPSAPFAFVNCYGPTETTVFVTRERILAEGSAPLAIGRPFDGVSVHLLDAALRPVAPGTPGALFIGGETLARGYLDDPSLTARQFLPDPFSPAPGARMYRTGDLARRREDGALEFLGRADQQVKLRGHRVELGEIDAALALLPEVRASVTVLREDPGTERRLVSYVVPRGAATPATLRQALRAKLPEPLVPATFVLLEALPLTVAGKVDRAALPMPEAEPRAPTPDVVLTPTEALLLPVWRQVLRLESVHRDEHFMDLGGHSLLAAKLVTELRRHLGRDVPPRVVLETGTLAGLARWLDAAPSSTLPPVTRAPDADGPLSFAQERLWVIDQLVDDAALYNTSVRLQLQGVLDVAVLERALTEVLRRHEVLRTGFVARDGQPRLHVVPPGPFPWEVVDLEAVPDPLAEAEAREQAQARKPFDLRQPPLLRGLLLRWDDQRSHLLLTAHHAIFDGASVDLLLRELEALYPAFAEGRPSPLPELPVQARDVAAWERAQLQGPERERLLSWWTEHLGGELPVLALTPDHPRPPVQTFHGATLTRTVPRGLLADLEALGRREQATPFMALLAAYSAWLSRYSGQRDVVVGTPFASRAPPEAKGLMGFFVNTLALRIDLQGTPTFRELLARVRRVALAGYEHGALPFNDVLGAFGARRELSHAPLFQVMLVVQDSPAPARLLPGLTVASVGEIHTDKARFDLTLVVDFPPEGPTFSLEYNTDLFEPGTATRMFDHFVALLGAAVARPGHPFDTLPLLSAGERQRMLEAWNDTGTHAPEGCSHALFEAQARREPQKIAVQSGDVRWTYGELEARANQVASHLRGLGVGPEVRVGLLMERSPELVCAVLGIVKAGGVYVPLDPAHPDDRLTFMMTDSRMHAVVSGPGLGARAKTLVAGIAAQGAPAPTVVDWTGDAEALARAPTTPVDSGVGPEHLAYVIYTSGSTGRPKGVEVEHRAFYNLVLAKIEGFGIFPDSTVLQFVSFGFDVSVSDVFMTLAVGAKLLLRPPDVVGGPELAELLRREAVTVIVLPASVLATLPATELPALRSVIAGGEACSAELVDRWAQGRRFINAYGPTETTICTTMARCQPGGGAPPIGRPIPHARVYVLDARHEPVPPGVTGELYIAGAGLARGYLGRPDLTADRFLPDPFARAPGSRLYRTGDLARFLPDGSLMFVVRVDDQVKIRGFRIELGEIEATLRQHPGVHEALVAVHERGPGGKQLIAYVLGTPGTTPALDALPRFLRERLPEHMVPSAFIALEAFPRTPNGKVDRRALPVPAHDALQRTEPPVAPRTLTEEILVEIWCEVLRLPTVGVLDDFFALGGQSILATQVMARVRERFELSLSVRVLFEAPVLAALAERIEQALVDDIGALSDAEVTQALDTAPTARPRAS
ncbi:amino acid adenylation domain-containing protein [Corallococcus llansteffanensis]|uniref:Amino acid adenylation domain-containing protein n=1 Tax=Corallococcus llansteffanensis TaxID=2316731 RepID=A0A3A8NY78_9BACT|nr:amino acid adenylation domain-containing protein [Corallococcus llansteffanensis]